ncbi:MAG: glycosyltransferase, partial [Thermoanaerobaculales bacterium]|nr:glycosyltransferase [Thermoanaerobaculales bacterium]
PEIYRGWLKRMLYEVDGRPGNANQFVFINAWNEWAEGASLEPSLDLGRSYLEATREAVHENRRLASQLSACPPSPVKIDADLLAWRMNPKHTESRSPGCRPLLLVSHDATRYGAQLVLLNIIKHLVESKDLELFLLLCGGGDVEREFTELVHTISLERVTATGIGRAAAIEQIVADFALRDPLLALCNTVVSGKVASVCQRAGIPVLSLLHELPTTIHAVGTNYLFEAIAASKRVLIVSQFVKNALIRSYDLDPERLTVLHNSFFNWEPGPGWRKSARAKVLQELDLPDNTFLVLGCGSIHHRKGTDLFVQLAREVLDLGGSENIFFLWIGADQSPTFRKWCEHDIEASGLQERVRLAGPRKSTSDYFAASDAFALTSREDPFPMVNLEAMSRGVAVVAFADAGGAPEVLNDGAGIVVPYLDVRAMAKAMICLSEAPHYREKISSKAAEKMQNGYRWERYMLDLLAIFEEDFGFRRQPTAAPGTRN